LGLQTYRFGDLFVDAKSVSAFELRRYLTSAEKEGCERRIRLMLQVDKTVLREIFAETLRLEKRWFAKGSLIDAVVTAERNRQILLEPLPERSISFCVILLQEVEEEQIAETVQHLKDQSYRNWSLVCPVRNLSAYESDARVSLLPSTGNKGHNIEQAVTRLCSHSDHALLLNRGERLGSKDALRELSECVRPREVLGCLLALEVEGVKLVPERANRRFHRKHDGIVNPDLEMMKNMSNHLRVFSVEVYKFLPQFDMRDPYGDFYEDRLIFVMSFYDIVRDPFDDEEKNYVVKKYAPQFNIPKRIAMARNVSVVTDNIDEVDRDQLRRTFTRLDVESMGNVLDEIAKWSIPFSKMLAFNEGRPYENFLTKEGPFINEAIIHQAWLGGALPPVKKYLFDKTAAMFPDFEMKLWTTENITKENFPISYQYMKTLCEFNRNSPYNKFAVITDILRHEALYKHGGFWKDSSMNFLKPILSHFRRY
jgi:hypothetical protein